MSDPDGIYVRPGDEPTLWVYPSQVHPVGPVISQTATGVGSASLQLAVHLARDVTGDGTSTVSLAGDRVIPVTLDAVGVGVADVGAHLIPVPTPSPGGGGNSYPTRLRPSEIEREPEPELEDREDDDVLALIVLGVI